MTGLGFVTAARTHVGRVRRLNEDSHLCRPELGLWAVADGMGGHAHGDRASRLITDKLAAMPAPVDAPGLLRAVERELQDCNVELRRTAGRHDVSGSTVVVLLAHGPHFAALWAGDSRLYRLRGGRLQQLTRDHSLVQELVEQGRIGPEEARFHPLRNRITRAVGVDAALELEALQGSLAAGDLFLLCTDGLTGELEDDEIAARLGSNPPEAAAEALLAEALTRGARDNVTLVLVAVTAGADPDTTLPRV
ncbi:MAG TPA: protein phosphatase 2C domain-containing protein [Geminicoccaceae bacterium]|nr:protein phosphatase 2C domain-containing protein [Geminicoccaceae bacterium]